MGKINVILDTDITNEIDDQFALVYLLKSLKNIKLEAITLAPFSQNRFSEFKSLEDNFKLSYDCTIKILDMMNLKKYMKVIYKGGDFIKNSKDMNDASLKMVEIARKNEKTIIIAIGAISNVAKALLFAPDIIPKVEVVWLGGHSFLQDKNDEYNFRQDVEAVRAVLNSKVKLTVIPCKNVAEVLSVTIYELEHFIKNKSEIGKFLYEITANMKDRKKEIKKENAKVIWDISAVAYVINPGWFNVTRVSPPKILDDLSYQMTKNKNKINFVNHINRNEIFNDFYTKMGHKYEK